MEFHLEEKEMRQVYCEQLIALAERDERIVLLEADLMKAMGTTAFKERFPGRTIDVGIAECNMVGIAAGLAACGKISFVDTFGPFLTRRANDQIAISVAYNRLNVKLFGADPGVSAELNGGTHMSLEDAAFMRVMPNMLVFEPVDTTQLIQALPQLIAHQGPTYTRLMRKKAPKVFASDYRFTLGKADILRDGADVAIFASGLMLHKALTAAEELAASGIGAAVVNIHTLKPLDVECVTALAKRCGAVVTAENGFKVGGLGGALCEVLAETCPTPVVRVGVGDRFGEVGFMPYLYKALEVDVPHVVAAARKALALKKG